MNQHTPQSGFNTKSFRALAVLCTMLILAIGGSAVWAQYQYTPYTPQSTPYQAAPLPSTSAPQPNTQYQAAPPPNHQAQAAPYPTTQQPTQYQTPPYPATQQPGASYQANQYQQYQSYQNQNTQQPTQYQTTPYPATRQPGASHQANQYQQYQSYQNRNSQQPTQYQPNPYATTQQPGASYRTARSYSTAPAVRSASSNVYPATGAYTQSGASPYGSNQVEPTRYIQPSTQPLTAGARQPISRPAASAANVAPYSNPPGYGTTSNYPTPSNNNPSAPVSLLEGQTIVDVRIVGNHQASLERIRSMIGTRKGREFSKETVQQDVRKMSRSGLFVNVKPSYQETPQGPIVIFEVIERPILKSIKFIGALKVKRSTLLKESKLKEGDAANPFAVEEARKTLEYYYHDQGYAQARVSIHKGNKAGDREAVFVINEGTKQKILWTKFVGNTVVSDSRLKTQIESKEGILWFINGQFSYERIEEDKKKLEAYYKGLGYFDAKIGPEVSFTSENWAMVTFVINEGPRYKVRDVRFLGNKIFTDEQLRKNLELISNRHFNQNEMNADTQKLQERYGRVGYVFADIKAQPRFLEEPGTLDMVYSIKEGKQYAIGEVIIKIKGDGELPRTQKSVLLERFLQSPGDIIDIKKFRESERLIRASGVFATNPATGAIPRILINQPDEPEETEYPDGPYGRNSGDRVPQARGQSRW